MKSKYILVFAFLILMCKSAQEFSETEIVNLGSLENINKVCDKHIHENMDVEFFSRNSENDNVGYTCTIYKPNNGKIRGYTAHIFALYNYDLAYYKWLNDSTLTFYYKNKYHESKKFTITGYNTSTSLSMED